jgi:hypothetical protein
MNEETAECLGLPLPSAAASRSVPAVAGRPVVALAAPARDFPLSRGSELVES